MSIKRTASCLSALSLLSLPLLYAQELGVSHPEQLNDPIVATQSSAHYVKPSAGTPRIASAGGVSANPALAISCPTVVPATGPAASPAQSIADTTVYKPYVPLYTRQVVADDVNSGVVVDVPAGPNELAVSTRLSGQLQRDISTQLTKAGSVFSASLTAPVMKEGRVLLPQGTVVSGRVTQIHGGRRISGASAIHLQPNTLTLPDGTIYHVHAEVVDLDHYRDSKVNGEGTIVNNTHGKATAGALGFTTGTAVIAGAMLGGGVGAVVGLGVGGGLSAVWWLKQDRQQTLPVGTEIVFALDEPLHLNAAPQFSEVPAN